MKRALGRGSGENHVDKKTRRAACRDCHRLDYWTIQVVLLFIFYLIWLTLDERATGFQLSRTAKVLIFLVVGVPVFVYYIVRTRRGRVWKTALKLTVYLAILLALAIVSSTLATIIFHKY